MKGLPSWLIVVLKVVLVGLSAVLADQSAGGPVASLVRPLVPGPALGAELLPNVRSSSGLKLRDMPQFAKVSRSA